MNNTLKICHKIILLSLLFFISSCIDKLEKEIDYNTIYAGDKLIVHGFVSPENGVELLLKKTLRPNDVNGDDRVLSDDLDVSIQTESAASISLQAVGDYQYTNNDAQIEAEGNYTFQAQSAQWGTVSSSSINLPTKTLIDSLKILVESSNSGYFATLLVYFQNIDAENAFYIKVFPYKDGIQKEILEDEKFNPYSLIYDLPKGVNMKEYALGRTYTFDSLRVELYSLSNDLKRFLISEVDYDESKADPFYPQPYSVYSNIENGYGIFGAYTYDTQMIEKPQ